MFTSSRLSTLMATASLPSPDAAPRPRTRREEQEEDASYFDETESYSELDDLATLSGEPESELKSHTSASTSKPTPASKKCTGPFASLRRRLCRSPPRCGSASASARRGSGETLRPDVPLDVKADPSEKEKGGGEPPSYTEALDSQHTSTSKSKSTKSTRKEKEAAHKDADPLALLMGRYGPGGGVVPTPVLPPKSKAKDKSQSKSATREKDRAHAEERRGSPDYRHGHSSSSSEKTSPPRAQAQAPEAARRTDSDERRREEGREPERDADTDALTTLMGRYGPGGGVVPTPVLPRKERKSSSSGSGGSR